MASIFTYGLGDIMRRLGQDGRSARWQLRFIASLIDEEDFPAGLPNMRGGRLIRTPIISTRWHRTPVDEWFMGRVDPDAAEAVERAARIEAARVMDARAASIGLRVVNGGRP